MADNTSPAPYNFTGKGTTQTIEGSVHIQSSGNSDGTLIVDGATTLTGAVTVTGQLSANGGLGQAVVQGLNGSGTAPAVAGVTHCVSSSPVGHDLGGSFVLTTDATSVTAGTIATVTFGTALTTGEPVAVLISVVDTTSTLTNVTTVIASASTTAITIKNTASMTASHTFLVTYIVVVS
jgi:hypothetical protein